MRKTCIWSVKITTINETRNPHCLYRYTTKKIILQNLLPKSSWCLSKSKIPVYANFIQFTKKYQWRFWTKRMFIFNFTTTFLTFPSPTIELYVLAKAPTKYLWQSSCSNFAIQRQQRYILQKQVKISKGGLNSLVNSLRDFLKTFEHKRASADKFNYRNPKSGLDLQSQKTISAQKFNDIIEHPNRQIRLAFRFENNNSCVLSIKKFELHGNHFNFTENVNLNDREIHHLYKNRYYVANKCEIFESNYDV